MHKSWSKGHTKHTHPSLMRTSRTMKLKHIDNFAKWRDRMRLEGRIPSEYPAFRKDGNLAELIGVVLGDGHLRRFPRTEELSIFSNSSNTGFVKRYAGLVKKILGRKPAVTPHGKVHCTRIRIYQKHIQSRLDIPYSPRGHRWISVPEWILKDRKFVVRYLRGLYEAEGSHSVHERTSTYKVFFTNRNISMLRNVYQLLKMLGFHPHRSLHQVQLSRKEEVYAFLKLIEFRKYG